jgi:general stress protein 26
MNADIIAKAANIINSNEEAYFSVVNSEGYPETATRSNIHPEGIKSCYFSTGAEGAMAVALKENSKTSVCFRQGGNNVTLLGVTKIITDLKVKKDLWLDWFIDHFPGGYEDPDYCLVHFTTRQVSLWIDREVSKFSIKDISDPQSYCGLLCRGCSFKESHGCKGCMETKGNPFHGSCKIAQCCQEKGLAHCGECPEMPCKNLKIFSCGEGEHCDNPKGARLEMLKYWV